MNNPLGYNPVGESAPGLPRHDKQLPGHISGQYNVPDFGGGYAPTGGGYTPTGGGYAPGGFDAGSAGPSWFGLWSARAIMAFVTYLTLPVQLALYPLAALPALAAGYYVLHASPEGLLGFDPSMANAWTCAWAVLLPAVRLETTLEHQVPGYRLLRHLFRLTITAGSFYYFSIHDQGDPPQTALTIALVVAVAAHFILRAKLLKGIWDGLQTLAWLRKN